MSTALSFTKQFRSSEHADGNRLEYTGSSYNVKKTISSTKPSELQTISLFSWWSPILSISISYDPVLTLSWSSEVALLKCCIFTYDWRRHFPAEVFPSKSGHSKSNPFNLLYYAIISYHFHNANSIMHAVCPSAHNTEINIDQTAPSLQQHIFILQLSHASVLSRPSTLPFHVHWFFKSG